MRTLNTMRSIFYLLVISALAAGCQAGSAENTLEKLTAQRDSLKTQYNEIAEQLSALDEEIRSMEKEKGVARKLPVSVMQINTMPFEHFVEVQGTVVADKNIVMNAEVAGTVKQILVKEGARVRAGQAILKLDTEILSENIKEVREQLELAHFVFEKQDRLWKQNIGSELDYRKARNNVRTLESRLSGLQAQLDKSTVQAPFSGTVDEIFPRLGEMLAPGMPACRLVNLQTVKVEAELSERYVGSVRESSKALVHFPATGETQEVKIARVGSYINPNNRTFKVVGELENRDRRYLPNMVARVMVRDYFNEDAMVVPSRIVMQDLDGNDYVYVLTRGQELPGIRKVVVQTGLTYNGQVEILEGLEGNEELVVDGARSVRPGDVVSVIK